MKHQLLFVEDGIAIIRLRGELDHHATQLIREEISQSLYRGKLRAIIWNLQELHFMDSSGIGLILGRMRDFVPSNGQTVILHPSETMKKIFQYSGLGSYVWETTEQETIDALGGILNGQ
ncbi:MAG: anti-sigma factor antagonist [Planococcaceae bacterium]|jgi:stage II sporulation protein AA (anti-sigma F factor antagonist)|uniref:STAS domain-containing protein n=1 Tax=Paenisporosarcina quisquiliarum TaxID=365346 RepID=UPI0024282F9E|nr:anti-sigma factor antagonist [Bacillota bacterium]MDX1771758.1 anti-sigma factor antagonist [Planococcaceae bacterium]